jgi:hypothetical protein
MQRARAILSSVTCPALQYFRTLSHKRHGFRKQNFENRMCVLTLSTIFLKHFSFFGELGEIYEKRILVFMKHTGYSCQILMKLEFSRQIFENIQI